MIVPFAHRAWRWMTSEIVLLLGAAVVVAAAWGFAEVADEVAEGSTQSFDEAVVASLRTGDDLTDAWGPGWLQEAAVELTTLGGSTLLTLLTIGVILYLALRRLFPRMALVLVATIGGAVWVTLMKAWFDRPRPDVVPHLTVEHSMSFPSGHAAMSAAVYLTLGVLLAQASPERRLKAFFMVSAIVLTLLIGASRVYLGVHYPTDVLAGWCVGLAWAALVWLAGWVVHRRSAREQAEQRAAEAAGDA